MEKFRINPTLGGFITVPADDSACELLQVLHGDRDIYKRLGQSLPELLANLREVAQQANLSLRICGSKKEPTVLVWRKRTAPLEPLELPFEELHGDGAKWGVSDFYDEHREALEKVLASGAPFDTGWYGVKKEIESARISRARRNGAIALEVSAQMDDALELADTAVWAAAGKNPVCSSGFDALAQLGLTEPQIEALLAVIADTSELSDENTAQRDTVIGGRSRMPRLCEALDEMADQCEKELEAWYETVVEVARRALADLRVERGISCRNCKHFSRGWNDSRTEPGQPDECAHPKWYALLTKNRNFPFERGCKFYAARTQPAREDEDEAQ